MSKTMIRDCNCEHDYQDSKYGFKKRVFNAGMKQYACTVCSKTMGSVESVSSSKKEKK